jgi:hypothetical protein
MTDRFTKLGSSLREGLHRGLRAGRFGPLHRLARLDRDQWQALAAYRGLVHQAFATRPLAPQISSDLWDKGGFHPSADRKAFFSPARRELENSSHHYGHDVQLKRHAGLPLIGVPLPWLLEHGLKVSRTATFESPRSWTQGYLCMGPLRAAWLQERFAMPAVPIGPWVAYAQPLLSPGEIQQLRDQLGSTLLVVLAHSWDEVERKWDMAACIDAVAATARAGGYSSVIWLRHWKDPVLQGLPANWIVACNGHRSNPWFLDAMRTLLELSDGLVSNAFGTHLGYGVALGLRLHWLPVEAEQDLSTLRSEKAQEEALEWEERQRLSAELGRCLSLPGMEAEAAVRALLDPYWGFDRILDSGSLCGVLVGRSAGPAA